MRPTRRGVSRATDAIANRPRSPTAARAPPRRDRRGQELAFTETSRMNRIPRKNVGADWLTRARLIAAWSIAVLRRGGQDADGIATRMASPNAVSPSSTVAGKRSTTTSRAGDLTRIDWPKSPRSTLPRKTAYCTGSGRSRPSSARTRANSLRGASGGSSSGTGSPDSRITTNTTVETSHSATRARPRRPARKTRKARSAAGPALPPRPGPAPGSGPGGTVEATDLELLERVRRPLHVLCSP